MKLFDNITKKECAQESDKNEQAVSGIEDIWQSYNLIYSLWQKRFALSIVCNLLSSVLINAEWRTKKEGKSTKGDLWYRLNLEPNIHQSAAEFYAVLSEKLILERSALIIETARGGLYVADSYGFENGTELIFKANTFINVVVEGQTLARSFMEGEHCMYLRLPHNGSVQTLFEEMANEYSELKGLIKKGALKAMGTKYNLHLEKTTGTNKNDDIYDEKQQKKFKELMDKENAVFVTREKQTLKDLTEKQRGSEVQQVIELADNTNSINTEILCMVGKAFGIPKALMMSEYTQDNEDTYAMAMTFFAKPIVNLIDQKFTQYFIERRNILLGCRIEANLSSVQYRDLLDHASQIDKLVGSGAYSINEIRDKAGDDPTENGDVRFITKNYAEFNEYLEGGTIEDGNENEDDN